MKETRNVLVSPKKKKEGQRGDKAIVTTLSKDIVTISVNQSYSKTMVGV